MEDLFGFKQRVHAQCVALLAERVRYAEGAMDLAKEAVQNDTKSSAGDKHETGRAMAQLELDKQQAALHHLLDLVRIFDGMDPGQHRHRVEKGSLLKMEQGLFYVAAALGKIEADGLEVMVISTEAPLLSVLARMGPDDVREFKGTAYRLIDVA